MNVRPSMAIVSNNRLLLMKYTYNGAVVLALPGGNPDEGETLEQTLIRELREELHIAVKITEMLLAGEVIFDDRQKSTLHTVFRGNLTDGTPQLNPVETTAQGLVWLDLSEIDNVNMYPNVGARLKTALLSGGKPNSVYVGRISQRWF